MVSGGRYIVPVGETLRATFNGLQIKEKFVGKFEPGHVYCLVNWGQFHLLAAPGLAAPAERPYTVQVAHHGREECRPGSESRRFHSLERDDFSSGRHPALPLCLRMIFSENRSPLFGIML